MGALKYSVPITPVTNTQMITMMLTEIRGVTRTLAQLIWGLPPSRGGA